MRKLTILGMIALLALAFGLPRQDVAHAVVPDKVIQQKVNNDGGQTSHADSVRLHSIIATVLHEQVHSGSICKTGEMSDGYVEAMPSVPNIDGYVADADSEDDDDAAVKDTSKVNSLVLGTTGGGVLPGFVFSGTAVRYHTRR